MQTVHAYIRTSHSYRDGWRHLDGERFVASVKVTPPRQTEENFSDSYENGPSYVQFARAPSGANIKQLMSALRDTMGGSRCRHDYDCCGCIMRRVQVSHLGSRRLMISTETSYNY